MTRPKKSLLGLKKRKSTFLGHLRANFLTGLVIVAPAALTIYIIWTAIGIIDSWVLPLIPDRYIELYSPQTHLGFDIRGIGVIIFLIFTLLGWLFHERVYRSNHLEMGRTTD